VSDSAEPAPDQSSDPIHETASLTRAPSRSRSAVAGVVGAAVALAVGEVVSSLGSTGQSLVGGVGNELIDRAAGALVVWAISWLGTNDKPALLGGIVVVVLLLGAPLGIASSKNPWVGRVGFVVFGALGIIAGWRDDQANPTIVMIAGVLAILAGITTMQVLLRVAATGSALIRTSDTPVTPHASRRTFFGWAGGAGVFAVAAAYGGRQLAGRSAAEAARAKVSLPTVQPGPEIRVSGNTLDGLTPYLTPNDRFYRIDTALIRPQIEPTDWSLGVTGLVEHPISISYEQLLAMPMVEEVVTLSCVSNEVGGDLVGNARWQGVPLDHLLALARPRPEAGQIVGISTDGWTGGFPTSIVDGSRPVLVAVGMNGEPLPIDHGFPARLVVAGLYGYVSATKWLTEIRLTTWGDFDGYWIDKGWSKEGPIKTQSRIDLPRATQTIAAGPTKIAGVAWAPTRGIARVEVQVDDGQWTAAGLRDVASDNTWRQWVLDWEATPGDHVIRARATDGEGAVQVDSYSPPEPNGATGYPTRRVRVR